MRERPIWRRYVRFLGGDPARDVADELEFHFSMRVEDLMRSGMSEPEARERLRREFGDVEAVSREMEGIRRRRQVRERRAQWWDSLGQDVRFAGRTLRRSPGFSAAAILTLALGIGGTTAVFSVVKAVLVDPLPYAEPGRLARFYEYDADNPSGEKKYVSGPHFQEIRRRASSFEDVAALYTYSERGADLTSDGRAERLRILEVGSGYFGVLRAPPAIGRGFDIDEETGSPLAVLSHDLWRTRFAADPAILGRTIELSAERYMVVGVAQRDFEDPVVGPVDAWLPLDLANSGAQITGNHFLTMIGRLRNGISLEQAREEMTALDAAFAEQWPEVGDDRVMVVGLQEDLVGGSRGALHLLLLAAGLVLLVASVNVANLLLVRSAGRMREFAIRSSLGSGRGRLARQLLVESGVLALLGGLAGLCIAWFGVEVLVTMAGESIPRLSEIGMDLAVLLFALAVTAATGICFGLAPVARFAGTSPVGVLRKQGRGSTGSKAHAALRTGFAVAQVGLALVLLAGAGVLLTSFYRLQQVDLGFRPDGVLTFEVHVPDARYDASARALFSAELIRRLEEVPGVRNAAAVSRLPATGTYHSWGTRATTGPLTGNRDVPPVQGEQRVVEGDYFDLLGIQLLDGRLFDARDALAGGDPGAVLSRTSAERLFPGISPLGHSIRAGGQNRVVIGVVEDVAIDPEGTAAPGVYHLHSRFADNRNWALTYLLRVDESPREVIPKARAVLAAMDPQLVLHRPAALTEVIGRGTAQRRFALVLMLAFAGVAVLLAALGLYGVLSYAVRQRTREMGIRIALGATAGNVRGLVLRHALLVVALGIAGGTLGALALGRWLSSLAFEVSPTDPRIIAATALLLSIVALLSSWLPAWRASRVEPRIAMDAE